MIFFNVKEVREFLIKNGYVYTLCKRGRKEGQDTAVYRADVNNPKTITQIGGCNVEGIIVVLSFEHLEPYVEFSGFYSRYGHHNITAREWYILGVKLHKTTDLALFKVTLLK